MKNKFRIVGVITGLIGLFNFGYGLSTLSITNVSIPSQSTLGSYDSGYCVYAPAGYGPGRLNILDSSQDLIYSGQFESTILYCPLESFYIKSLSTSSLSIRLIPLVSQGSCPECPTCPEINTGEILSGYILESSIDNEYCELNNLCPVYTGDSGNDLSGVNWSLLYINDIQHIGAGIINITIPEEFDWDYLYTGNGDQFDLNISGYNVDSAYIDGIITTQKTLPNTIDFNNIVSVLIPKLIPGLVIILFLLFVFRFIKKLF